MFALLVFFAAFVIEGIGTYVSVVGLSALFAANPVIIVLAMSLDLGKVVAVSFLYKHWKKINLLMKGYMSIAAVVLVLITSTGAFGFLSGEFQKAISETGTQSVMIASLEEEKGRLQKRKEDIDAQISKLATVNNTGTVTRNDNRQLAGKTALIKQFAPEVERLNTRLAEIDAKLPELKIQNISKELHVGPIIYIAKAFATTPEIAVKYVILTIIFVFDPLAISLLIAGNFLIELKRKEKEEKSLKEKLDAFDPERHSLGPTEYIPDPEEEKLYDLKGKFVGNDDVVGNFIHGSFTDENGVTHHPIMPPELKLPSEQDIQPPIFEELKPSVVESVAETLVRAGHEPEEALQLAVEAQRPHARRVKIAEHDGREVISLEEAPLPASSLERVKSVDADVQPDDFIMNTRQRDALRTHYADEAMPDPTVTVGFPRS
jgi:hypothetical protein